MTTPGKLELTIKINELPTTQSTDNGWQSFEVDCDGRIVSITVKPKIWKKLEEAQANYPQWVAAISGKMGEATDQGFILNDPNIQVFEKKPKEPKPEATGAEGATPATQVQTTASAEPQTSPKPQVVALRPKK